MACAGRHARLRLQGANLAQPEPVEQIFLILVIHHHGRTLEWRRFRFPLRNGLAQAFLEDFIACLVGLFVYAVDPAQPLSQRIANPGDVAWVQQDVGISEWVNVAHGAIHARRHI